MQIYVFYIYNTLIIIGGNNGSTVTAGIIANREKISWQRKEGLQHPNYYGSLTQATTIRVGSNQHGKEVHIPFRSILPMVNPNDLVIGKFDIFILYYIK